MSSETSRRTRWSPKRLLSFTMLTCGSTRALLPDTALQLQLLPEAADEADAPEEQRQGDPQEHDGQRGGLPPLAALDEGEDVGGGHRGPRRDEEHDHAQARDVAEER